MRVMPTRPFVCNLMLWLDAKVEIVVHGGQLRPVDDLPLADQIGILDLGVGAQIGVYGNAVTHGELPQALALFDGVVEVRTGGVSVWSEAPFATKDLDVAVRRLSRNVDRRLVIRASHRPEDGGALRDRGLLSGGEDARQFLQAEFDAGEAEIEDGVLAGGCVDFFPEIFGC